MNMTLVFCKDYTTVEALEKTIGSYILLAQPWNKDLNKYYECFK